VAVEARLVGFRVGQAQVTLTAGATISQDFTLVTNPLR
jgi:hypothetical protein